MDNFSPSTDESPEDFDSPTPEEIEYYRQEAEEFRHREWLAEQAAEDEYRERIAEQAEEEKHREWLAEEGDEAEYSPPPRPPFSGELGMLRHLIYAHNERHDSAIRKQLAVQQIIVKHANQIREELAAESRSIGSEAFTDRLVRRVLNPVRIMKSSTEELLILHRAAREHKGENSVKPSEYSSLEIIEPADDADRAKVGSLLKSVDVRVEPE